MNLCTVLALSAAISWSGHQWRDTVAASLSGIREKLPECDIETLQSAFAGRLSPQGKVFGKTHPERCAGPSPLTMKWTDGTSTGVCERAVIVFFELRMRKANDCIERITHLVVRDRLESFGEARASAARIVNALWSNANEPAPHLSAWTIAEAREGVEKRMSYEEHPEKYPAGGAPQREIIVQVAPSAAGNWCVRVDVHFYRFGEDLEPR